MTDVDAVTVAEPSGISLDPVTFSVILNRFDAIVNEMTLVLERSAWTSTIALSHDYSCAIYDAKHRQVSMHDAIPIHTTSMGLMIETIAEHFAGDVGEADVFICNDPYSNNTHIGDLLAVMPVFIGEELVFWSVCRAHHLDVGAIIPAGVSPAPRDVWQEGFTIPPTRLTSGGAIEKDILRMILANVRYAGLIEGDIRAQIGTIERGRERLVELCEEYGTSTVQGYAGAILEYASRRMADEVRAIPEGTYEGTTWVDTDGYSAFNIPIHVRVDVSGDQIRVDFEGSGPQGTGGVNGTLACAIAAGTIPFMCYIDPDIPHNEGCIEHVTVSVPRGTLCCAEYPASTSTATIVPASAMIDAVNKAMIAAIPDRVPAGGARAQNTKTISGQHGRDGRPWGLLLLNNSAGFGAACGADGWPLCYATVVLGCGKATSVERFELLYPLRVESWEIEPESMGAGEWIGGPGSRLAIRPITTDRVIVSGCGDGADNPPHGAKGGMPGFGGGQYVEDVSTGVRRYLSAAGAVELAGREERWVGISSGGGGWGNPVDRDEDAVRRDARDGIVSRACAKEVFGVVLSPEPDPTIDAITTAQSREKLRAETRPLVEPTVEHAATWLEEHIRPQDGYILNPRL